MERENSNQGQLPDSIEKFLKEVSNSLPEPKPPTFTRELKEAWPNLTFDSKLKLVLCGIGMVGLGITGLGGGIYAAGEFSSIQSLKDVSTPLLLTGCGIVATAAFTYVTASALCLLDQ